MVRPDRFELPTFWFVASIARRVKNLQPYLFLLRVLQFQWLPYAF